MPTLACAPLVVLFSMVLALLGCAPGDGRGNEGRNVLWLPADASTDAGIKCYAGGFCDLPFTSASLDPDRLTEELERRFRDAKWEARCPAPPDQRGWQTFGGRGIVGFGDDAAVPGTSRYWHCAWHGSDGDIVSYHLQTIRMRDGRQPLTGYATYTPRGQ